MELSVEGQLSSCSRRETSAKIGDQERPQRICEEIVC